MMRMKPRIDRAHVLRMEARRRAIEGCLHTVPDLLRPEEHLGTPIREGDRIVIPVGRPEGAEAGRPSRVAGPAYALA